MKKLSLLVLFLICIFCTDSATAQQDPQYTQYMYNMNVVNPAYAGSKETLSLTGLYRQQWSGLPGAPKTITFSGHSPVTDAIGLGLSAVADELGPVKETNVNIDFSYTLQVADELKLALGLKAGGSFLDIGLNGLELQDPDDPFFNENIDKVAPNIGAGAFFYGNNFYVGLSVPNFLNTVHVEENGVKIGSETQHYFATAGYVYQATDNLKLKPSVMVKSAFSAPTSFDVNLNALYLEKFELGASYRLDDSFSFLVGFQALPTLRIGYAYDNVTSDLKVVAPASHEVILTFDLAFKKKSLRSPRYF